jgi:hypothetical protein
MWMKLYHGVIVSPEDIEPAMQELKVEETN